MKSTLVDAAEANSRIDFGLVGCGARGTWIAGLFAKHGGYNVAAVAVRPRPIIASMLQLPGPRRKM